MGAPKETGNTAMSKSNPPKVTLLSALMMKSLMRVNARHPMKRSPRCCNECHHCKYAPVQVISTNKDFNQSTCTLIKVTR